ncbi:MAG: 16S rRNA (uracil(1498)-N(3))-methyltransferase [Saprospiraceae bacterium]|nr:16S rRNA (uracil(1498)-N(3))-methyltransferase [Saprospiraceae bacterium]
MQLFFTIQIEGNSALLSEEESLHCAQVLRKKPGDWLCLVDGLGNWYEGPLIEVGKKQCRISIQKTIPEYQKRPFHLHIGLAPTKQMERTEWFLEKVTEIGVDEITLLQCKRSERAHIRIDRLQKIILSAMKQSLRAYLPRLHDLTPFEKFVESANKDAARFIAYMGESRHKTLKENYPPGENVYILIGPEGDFSPEEIQKALDYGFSGINLGPHRLRTETAGIAACFSVNMINGY